MCYVNSKLVLKALDLKLSQAKEYQSKVRRAITSE